MLDKAPLIFSVVISKEIGETCAMRTKALNDAALVDGSRLLSSYTMRNGTKLWIITEASDNDGNRAATTILLPSEY